MQLQVKISNAGVILPWWRTRARAVDVAIARSMTQVGYEARRELIGKEGLSKFPRHDPIKRRTQAAPFVDPPSQATGKLRTTVFVSKTVRHGFGKYEKSVGPTMFYAQIQDEGRTIYAKSPWGMQFVYGRDFYSFVRSVTIPPRPYMKPARDRLEQGGKIEQIFSAEFAKAFASPPSSP